MIQLMKVRLLASQTTPLAKRRYTCHVGHESLHDASAKITMIPLWPAALGCKNIVSPCDDHPTLDFIAQSTRHDMETRGQWPRPRQGRRSLGKLAVIPNGLRRVCGDPLELHWRRLKIKPYFLPPLILRSRDEFSKSKKGEHDMS